MADEIIIVVKARNETSALFKQVKDEAAVAGDDAGKQITERITEHIRVVKDDPTLRQAGAPLGDVLGQTISEHVSEKIKVSVDESIRRDVNGRLRDSRGRFVGDSTSTVHEKVKLDVDVDGDHFDESVDKAIAGRNSRVHKKIKVDVDVDEKDSGSFIHKFIDGIEGKLRSGLTGVLGSVFTIKNAAIAAGIATLAPPVGAAISSAVLLALGGGAIGAGMYSAVKNDPQLKGAIGELRSMVSKAFSRFGVNFKPAVADLLDGGTGKGGLLGVLRQIQPMIDQIGHDLAPVADHLSRGVVGFLQNALPGVLRAIDGSAPIVDTLADKLPGIGTAIGKFFDDIRKNGPQAAEFFGDLLELVGLLIRALGRIIGALTNAYANWKVIILQMAKVFTEAIGTILHGADVAFGWIPGLGPKLHAAAGKFDQFQADVNRQLQKIKDRNVKVKIQAAWTGATSAINAIGSLLARRAAGGITGSANGATPSGLTWVGEHGPELLAAPAGSRIYSNPDSMRMAGAGRGDDSRPLIVQLMLDGKQLAVAMVDPQRRFVRDNFGGSVQAAYGRG
jgi:hypothetical protein